MKNNTHRSHTSALEKELLESSELLTQSPENSHLRERVARLLMRAERTSEAYKILSERFINFCGHDDATLPCQCKQCFDGKNNQVDIHGTKYIREFCVAKGRFLFFWIPEGSQVSRSHTRRAVRARLWSRLERGERVADAARAFVPASFENPFTGQKEKF